MVLDCSVFWQYPDVGYVERIEEILREAKTRGITKQGIEEAMEGIPGGSLSRLRVERPTAAFIFDLGDFLGVEARWIWRGEGPKLRAQDADGAPLARAVARAREEGIDERAIKIVADEEGLLAAIRRAAAVLGSSPPAKAKVAAPAPDLPKNVRSISRKGRGGRA